MKGCLDDPYPLSFDCDFDFTFDPLLSSLIIWCFCLFSFLVVVPRVAPPPPPQHKDTMTLHGDSLEGTGRHLGGPLL